MLAGEENPRFAQRLDQHTVRRVLELLRRTHDVICVDTGNNVESANWQTVLQSADQLVITTVPREDAAFTADWMLDLLNEVGLGDLVANAVTLLSCPTPGPLAAARRPAPALRHPDPGGRRGAVRPGAGGRLLDRVQRLQPETRAGLAAAPRESMMRAIRRLTRRASAACHVGGCVTAGRD